MFESTLLFAPHKNVHYEFLLSFSYNIPEISVCPKKSTCPPHEIIALFLKCQSQVITYKNTRSRQKTFPVFSAYAQKRYTIPAILFRKQIKGMYDWRRSPVSYNVIVNLFNSKLHPHTMHRPEKKDNSA
jgi:hypothetical protein